MRSARSASSVFVEELEEAEEWWVWPCGKACPWWPSLMAVVDRADKEVVPEFGVPLWIVYCQISVHSVSCIESEEASEIDLRAQVRRRDWVRWRGRKIDERRRRHFVAQK